MRKEIIGNAELYLGDCLGILPSLGRVDAVVTDPPYGIKFNYASHEDDPEKYMDLMQNVISGIVCNGPFAFWQAMINADQWHKWFPAGYRIFAACKGFVQFRPTAIQYSWDPVIFWGNVYKKPSVYAKDFHIQSLSPFGAGRETIDHPCPRPLEQVKEITEILTNRSDLVLDPFMGSGTTGVACMNRGRKFIGIEIEPKYFDIACERIQRAWENRPRLFEEEPRPKQGELV